jgi:hypothetical protein
MSLYIEGKDKILLGKDKQTGENIYLSKPTWDCGWYWSFGYLGNKNCHYHLNGYANGRNINMYDALIADYDLNETIKANLWVFCEVVKTIYSLKEAAEVLGRGGSHYTTNPFQALIKDVEYTKHLNEKVLPEVMQGFWGMFSS